MKDLEHHKGCGGVPLSREREETVNYILQYAV